MQVAKVAETVDEAEVLAWWVRGRCVRWMDEWMFARENWAKKEGCWR